MPWVGLSAAGGGESLVGVYQENAWRRSALAAQRPPLHIRETISSAGPNVKPRLSNASISVRAFAPDTY